MRKSIFVMLVITVFAIININAQTGNDYLELTREVIKIEKKAAIAEIMQLSEEQSVPFWTLYNEYQGKLYLVQNKRIALVKDFAKNYENMTNEKADELWISSMAFAKEVLALEKSYYKKFKKIIPAGKAALFFQAENKIETLIDAELALEIPLIETKE